MRKLVLDGNQIHNRDDLYRSLKEQIGPEGFYGNNLDALHDILTERAEPLEVEIVEPGALRESLGSYMDRLLRVLWDCSQEDPAGGEQDCSQENAVRGERDGSAADRGAQKDGRPVSPADGNRTPD